MTLNASVIVTTYNKPNELELVLCGLSQQKDTPLEILIADDGSNAETKSVVSKWSETSRAPIKHIWHEDNGNRKLKICNRAAKESQGNYLIFLDGDSIPHKFWVHDHIKSAKKNTVLCGRRVRLGPEITNNIDLEFVKSKKLEDLIGPVLSSALRNDTKRYTHGIRLPKMLARCLQPTERRLMGVNFSLDKSLFDSIGGYSDHLGKHVIAKERRREDAQLEIQLLKAGVKRYPLINQAIVYHLHHHERAPNKEIDEYINNTYESALRERKSIKK